MNMIILNKTFSFFVYKNYYLTYNNYLVIDMNRETNDFLQFNLNEAHTIFNSIVLEMQEANIPYDYNTLKQMEENSFNEIKNLLVKMDSEVFEYDNLTDKYKDFLQGKDEIYFKYIFLSIVSIIFIKLYHEIMDTEKFSSMLHYFVGLFLGGTFVGLLNKDLNEYQSDTKEKRDLINRLKTLKEEYKKNHDLAVIMIDYIFALNDNMWNELDHGKNLVK